MSGQIAIIRAIGGLVFDAVFEEQHESGLDVTDNPVETGVVVSDHAVKRPERVTIKAGVSDTPLRQLASDPYMSGSSRSREAYRLLQELQSRREPFDVQTNLKLYQNMLCTNIRTVQEKGSSSALVFEAELRELRIVTTQSVIYPPRRSGATQQQAGKMKQKGEQQGKPVTAAGPQAQPAKRKMVADSLLKTGIKVATK